MTALELHTIIGDLIVAILMAAAIVAALLYLVLLASGGFGMRSDDSDVIGSHLVSADGKAWDFSKSQSAHARAQRTVSAYDDKSAKATTKLSNDPDVWDGVEYDDDGHKYEIVPAQGETRPVKSDMDLEIVDAEIIPE
ncbi:MAG: hypothetical protein IPJ00_22615 [Saprospirales bacterium]|nr:hypothetical protein [Saprospirales bacterium]